MGIKVILAEDQSLIREAVSLLLENEADMDFLGNAADGQAALRLVRETSPDVVVMDITMPKLNGIETTRKITAGKTGAKVIALSVHSDKKFVYHMFKAGASGYILKDCIFEELLFAIRSVAKNQMYISPKIADVVMQEYTQRSLKNGVNAFTLLTGREREVLQLLSEGTTTKHIACLLKVSAKTIETHRQQIMEKLDMHSIAELTKYAIREGLTSL